MSESVVSADTVVENPFVESQSHSWTADAEDDNTAICLGCVLTEPYVQVFSSHHICSVPDLELQLQVVAATILENRNVWSRPLHCFCQSQNLWSRAVVFKPPGMRRAILGWEGEKESPKDSFCTHS